MTRTHIPAFAIRDHKLFTLNSKPPISQATDPRLKTLDNRIPHTMSMTHLTHRLKKAQLEEERFQEIELENKAGLYVLSF
jgi:hypothetical protein